MKFSVDRDIFLGALDVVSYPALVANVTPILNSFHLTADANVLTIMTNNVMFSAKTQIPIKSEEDGEVCVLSKNFMDFIASFKEGDITLSQKENKLNLKQKKISVNTSLFNVDEYPAPKKFITDKTFTVKLEDLQKEFESVAFASGTSVGYSINGIVLDMDEKLCYNVVGTDGRRAAGVIRTNDIKFTYIIPTVGVAMLSKCTGKNVTVNIGTKDIQFVVDKTIIRCGLIENKAPNYNKAFSSPCTINVTVGTEELQKAIKRASILVKNTTTDSVILDITKKTLTVSRVDELAGEAVEELDAESNGELKIAFNPDFLTCFLDHVEDEKITLGFNSNQAPLVYKNKNYIYIALPMRI